MSDQLRSSSDPSPRSRDRFTDAMRTIASRWRQDFARGWAWLGLRGRLLVAVAALLVLVAAVLAIRSFGTSSLVASNPVPVGWVKIVNRGTGLVLRDSAGPMNIEPAGEYYKIRCRDSGLYLALRDWTKEKDDLRLSKRVVAQLLDEVPASGDLALQWKIERLRGGFWRIANRDSGEYLEFRKPDALVVRQSSLRKGDPAQEWRIEPASAE